MPETIPFPERLRAELQALESRKVALIQSFVWTRELQGEWSLAPDLSALVKQETPPCTAT